MSTAYDQLAPTQEYEHVYQDFSARLAAPGSTPAPATEAAALVGRYPNLSEVELARLINLYRHFTALDLALMISDETLGPKLDRFFADHRSKIRTPFRQYATLVGTAVAGIAAALWAIVSNS
jgi:hypothetical protein